MKFLWITTRCHENGLFSRIFRSPSAWLDAFHPLPPRRGHTKAVMNTHMQRIVSQPYSSRESYKTRRTVFAFRPTSATCFGECPPWFTSFRSSATLWRRSVRRYRRLFNCSRAVIPEAKLRDAGHSRPPQNLIRTSWELIFSKEPLRLHPKKLWTYFSMSRWFGNISGDK